MIILRAVPRVLVGGRLSEVCALAVLLDVPLAELGQAATLDQLLPGVPIVKDSLGVKRFRSSVALPGSALDITFVVEVHIYGPTGGDGPAEAEPHQWQDHEMFKAKQTVSFRT